MLALLIQPDNTLELKYLNSLEDMQRAVTMPGEHDRGLIEIGGSNTFGLKVIRAYCHEEGRLLDYPRNLLASAVLELPFGEVLVGPVYFVLDDGGPNDKDVPLDFVMAVSMASQQPMPTIP